MKNLRLPVGILSQKEYILATEAQRATWLNLLLFCAARENGGVIANCVGWTKQLWSRQCGIRLTVLAQDCGLWRWEGDGLVVGFYPRKEEEKNNFLKKIGKKGGSSCGKTHINHKRTLKHMLKQNASVRLSDHNITVNPYKPGFSPLQEAGETEKEKERSKEREREYMLKGKLCTVNTTPSEYATAHQESPTSNDSIPDSEKRTETRLEGAQNAEMSSLSSQQRNKLLGGKESQTRQTSIPLTTLTPLANQVKSLRPGWNIAKFSALEVNELYNMWKRLEHKTLRDEDCKLLQRYFASAPAGASKWDYPTERKLFMKNFCDFLAKAYAWERAHTPRYTPTRATGGCIAGKLEAMSDKDQAAYLAEMQELKVGLHII